MKKVFLFVALFCMLVFKAKTGFAQTALTDTAVNPAIQKAVDLFYHTVNDDAHLYNGREHIMVDPRIKGSPYFLDAYDLQSGAIYYDGTLYTNVPFIYEITDETVVTRQYNNGVLINLVNNKIDYFNIFGHTFVHIIEPDSARAGINSGFYDRLYNGATPLFAKRQKIIVEDANSFERSYQQKDRFYIYKNGIYHPVSDKGSVLSVLKDKKKDLAKYLRQSKISYKNNPEYAMVKMAEYYDQLTH